MTAPARRLRLPTPVAARPAGGPVPRRARLAVVVALTAGLLILLPASPASAHPLGNFTVNQHAGLTVLPDRVAVELVVDMAEIPAFQTRNDIDADSDKTIAPAEADAYRRRICTDLRNKMSLTLDGQALPAAVVDSDLTFPPGQAGLATLRLTCRLSAPAERGTLGRLTFANANLADRVGWREVTAVGDGVRLTRSDVAARSASAVLTNYPEDLLSSPLDQRAAHLEVVSGSASGLVAAPAPSHPSVAPRGRGTDQLTAAFTGLVARQDFTLGFALLALLAAIALGAIHALAPGHGKTVMAAYLVGERGSLRQAALLGLTVTSTHTVGVLVLGLLLSGSTAIVPERLYPWLGASSGALLAGVGLSLLARAWRRRGGGLAAFGAHTHPHAAHHTHGETHAHGHRAAHAHTADGRDHDLTHAHLHSPGAGKTHQHDRPVAQPPVSRKALLLMGAAGGMVPSPSALVVLLGAIALGRTWFGIALVLGYGIGMALTLVAAGLLMVRARATLDRRLLGGRLAGVARTLPVMTASFVVIAGVGLTARAFNQM